MTKRRIIQYLVISFIVSLLVSVFWVNAPVEKGKVGAGLSLMDEILVGLMYTVVTYSYVLIIGGLISTIIHLFTDNSLIVLLVFLIAGIGLYVIDPWFNNSNRFILIVGALIFGVLDQFSLKKWGV